VHKLREESRGREPVGKVPLPAVRGGRDTKVREVQEAGQPLQVPGMQIRRALNMEISFATTNSGKVDSASRHLEKFGISVKHIDIELLEPRSEDIGFIAAKKAEYALSKGISPPLITNDSGFYISELGRFPGPYVNLFLKNPEVGIDGILAILRGRASRACEFVECVAYVENGIVEPLTFQARIHGRLSEYPKGDKHDYQWSDLFRIFIPEGYDITLAEMPWEMYKKWSMGKVEENSCFVALGKYLSGRR